MNRENLRSCCEIMIELGDEEDRVSSEQDSYYISGLHWFFSGP